MNKSMKKLGVALLGLGKYASGQLAPALQETKNCYLAGIITGDDAKAEQWAHKYKIPKENVYNYHNFDDIRNNAAIDIVYVVTPNALHADFVVRAARAGKHVICEKPMATTVEDCDRMIDACKKAGVSLSVGYRLHFEPYNRQMMFLGQTRKYGYIQKVVANDGVEEVEGWRLSKQLAGGGALMDIGIYCAQAANYVYNMSPIAVTAQRPPDAHPEKYTEVEEAVNFQLEYPGGYIAECSCSYSKKMNYLHASANNGWFELEPAFGYEGIKGRTGFGEMHFAPVNQQAVEMDSIAWAIHAGKPSPVPGSMGKEDVKLLLSIYEAMQSGARILLHPVHQASATTEIGAP